MTSDSQALEALAAAERRYRSLVERIPDAIWTCDERGAVTYCTANIERICGYTSEELAAAPLEELEAAVHPDDQNLVRESFAALVRDGQPFDIEYRRRDKHGTWRWLHNRAIATFERDGKPFAEGMLTDVTERRQLENEFQQAQKMEAIGQLTGGIAHDFNNILGAILANGQFLLEGLVEGDPRREDAEEIIASAQRAAALTRQLLAFSRRQVLEPTVVDLNSVVGGLEKMLRRLIGEDVELSIRRGENVGVVRADVGQIEQVIMNLVVNARDAMPDGGALWIEIENIDRKTCACSCVGGELLGRCVVLSIRDNGCGMDAAVKARAFEPFFTTKEKGKGTGLGLATCHGIIKQSGGHICLESEPGVGTVFHILLPRVEELAEHDGVRVERSEIGGNETILLIEDDDRVRAAVQRILSARGYQLLVASQGNEAIALAAGHPGRIDMVLSDVVMPGTPGPDLLPGLRLDRPDMRVLFMSGYTDHTALRREVTLNGSNFIQKPFLPEVLARKVRDVLDREAAGAIPAEPEAAPRV